MSSLAQARTGTGKTLAFLIPVLQNIINHEPSLETSKSRTSRPDIRAIIISPTRELAEQIAVEARKVARNTGVIVQTAVGGVAKASGLKKIMTQGCHVLVGTPGRLNDILSDRYSQIEAPNLSALVLDEADRLLDQGFAPAIQEIQNLLPRRDRQTLLFSATVPHEVMQIVNQNMKPDYQFVRTVKPGEQQTHEKVPQKVVQVAGFENLMPVLFELCKREMARSDVEMPFKAIVYLNATAEVSLALSVFQNLRSSMDPSTTARSPLHSALIVGIHSRLTQQGRTRTAEAFRRANCSIMFSSDVTARGMDFPNVTHVIQMGLPSNRDTYIHRIGRTARGDKNGEGYLFITPLELRESHDRLHELPLKPDDSFQTAMVDMTQDAQLPAPVAEILNEVVQATKPISMKEKSAAYLATLGVFNWFSRKQQLIDAMNSRSTYAWGLPTPPAISPLLASKLGLSRLSGINIWSRPEGGNEYGARTNASSYGRDRSGGSPRGYGNGGRGRTSPSSYGGDRSAGGYGKSGQSFERSNDRSASSGYGRGRQSFERSNDRSASSGYGRDRQSFGRSNDRSASSGYGRDRGKSRSGGDRADTSGQRGRTSRGSGGDTLSQLYSEQ